MLFLGTTFIGGDYTAMPTPTYSANLTYLTLSHGKYSDLYGTKNTDGNPTEEIPDEWDWDTIMRADYSTGKTMAGNMDWTVENVSVVAVKRRIKGTFDWYTVAIQPIEVEEDFSFSGVDRFNQSKVEYEYALVPYHDENPGIYSIESVYSNFDALFIVGRDKTYSTFHTTGNVNTTRNIPGNHNVPLNSRYAVFFHSGKMNYDSGDCDGKFYYLDEACQIVEDKGYLYKKGLMDFLTDGDPKVLKHSDGRIWLMQVIPSPTDSADGDYQFRNIAFNWIQIGEHDSNSDMYWTALNDVPEIYWDNI